MNKNLPRLLITGSEGLLGKKLVAHFGGKYEILKLDLRLGHDLNNEFFVADWFRANKKIDGVLICHAFNPVPTPNTKKIEPIVVSVKELRGYMDTNTVSVFDICRNYIKNNKKGVVVNVSSIYGVGSPRHDVYSNFVKPIGYSASKAASIMIVKYLATYYAPDFRLNSVILGGVNDNKKQDPGFRAKYGKQVPMKRLMNVDEITSVFDFLLDGGSTYVTGSEVYVDGGWTAW